MWEIAVTVSSSNLNVAFSSICTPVGQLWKTALFLSIPRVHLSKPAVVMGPSITMAMC